MFALLHVKPDGTCRRIKPTGIAMTDLCAKGLGAPVRKIEYPSCPFVFFVPVSPPSSPVPASPVDFNVIPHIIKKWVPAGMAPAETASDLVIGRCTEIGADLVDILYLIPPGELTQLEGHIADLVDQSQRDEQRAAALEKMKRLYGVDVINVDFAEYADSRPSFRLFTAAAPLIDVKHSPVPQTPVIEPIQPPMIQTPQPPQAVTEHQQQPPQPTEPDAMDIDPAPDSEAYMSEEVLDESFSETGTRPMYSPPSCVSNSPTQRILASTIPSTAPSIAALLVPSVRIWARTVSVPTLPSSGARRLSVRSTGARTAMSRAIPTRCIITWRNALLARGQVDSHASTPRLSTTLRRPTARSPP
jgi:hypothetical protein